MYVIHVQSALSPALSCCGEAGPEAARLASEGGEGAILKEPLSVWMDESLLLKEIFPA